MSISFNRLGALVLGTPRRCRPRLGTACALPGPTYQELQNNLQIAATCAGLGGSQQSQVVNLGWLLLVLGLGPFSKVPGIGAG